MNSQVDNLGQNLNETEQFSAKDKEKEELITYVNEVLQAASSRKEFVVKRNQKLMDQLGRIIIKFIPKNKNKRDGMHPGFEEAFEKYPNLNTILEKVSGNRYKHAREAADDVTKAFDNAIKTCDEGSTPNMMLTLLLGRFVSKYEGIVPDFIDEKMLSSQTELEMQLAYAKILKFKEIDTRLEELKDQIVQKCGMMESDDKRRILMDIRRLSPDETTSALLIVAKHNDLWFDRTTGNVVKLNKNDAALWELKFFLEYKLLGEPRDGLSRTSCDVLRTMWND